LPTSGRRRSGHFCSQAEETVAAERKARPASASSAPGCCSICVSGSKAAAYHIPPLCGAALLADGSIASVHALIEQGANRWRK